MTAPQFVSAIESRGLHLLLGDGGKLRLRGPQEAITPALTANLARYKAPLIEYLQSLPPLPAAIEEDDSWITGEIRDLAARAEAEQDDMAAKIARETDREAERRELIRVLLADAQAGLLPREAHYRLCPGSEISNANKWVIAVLSDIAAMKDHQKRQKAMWGEEGQLHPNEIERAHILRDDIEEMAYWYRTFKESGDCKAEKMAEAIQ